MGDGGAQDEFDADTVTAPSGLAGLMTVANAAAPAREAPNRLAPIVRRLRTAVYPSPKSIPRCSASQPAMSFEQGRLARTALRGSYGNANRSLARAAFLDGMPRFGEAVEKHASLREN